MELVDIRNEVLAHGFDPVQFGSARVNTYINDGLQYVCTEIDYYVDEAASDFSTVAGTASYALPAAFAKVRSLRDTNRTLEMAAVGLRSIDRSPVRSGAPYAYAMDGANVHLYPTPDGVYPMELRYWMAAAPLVNDTDSPTLPVPWQKLLWMYAVAQCYFAEDDAQQGQLWEQRFTTQLNAASADLKFPNYDMTTQAASWLEGGGAVGARGWSYTGMG